MKKLCSILGKRDCHEEYLHKLTFDHFTQCNSTFLRYPSWSKMQATKKDNLEDAKAGNTNLISSAYVSRIMFNYIKAEQEESSYSMDLDQEPTI